MTRLRRVLVANRGEIATRVIRTCHRMGLETIAVHSDSDRGLEFVERATSAIALGGDRVQDTYLSLDKLRDAIVRSGADAVHPGYGLLSEDPRLAALVQECGAVFIGPSTTALAVLGDKLQARRLASAAGLMPPPGTEANVEASSLEGLATLAAKLGYPLMVKAAAGGGGIGMQRVLAPEQLGGVLETCAKRAEAAFGDGRVYLEKAIAHSRHIEVQVARDRAGGCLVLGDRECSAQRRHQKVLEEAPSPAAFLDDAMRQRLYEGSCNLLHETDYVGVATVEFLVDGGGTPPTPYFLEVNARIQVEHPVTELVHDVDLVELQLLLAAGEAIDAAPHRRAPSGHAFEARLYAEDPAKAFLPQPGQVQTLRWASGPGVRVDATYRQGETITPYYDPLIGKLICHGPDRASALVRLERALADTTLLLQGPKGPRQTNLDLLRDLCRDAQLASGDYDSRLVERVSGQH